MLDRVKPEKHMEIVLQDIDRLRIWKLIAKSRFLYLLLLPGMLSIILFSYFPMYGLQLAFKEFMVNKGIMASPWVGFDKFRELFSDFEFWRALKNTFFINIAKILLGIPVPVILAIMINEISSKKYRRFLQTVYTLPHYISWVIVSGIFLNMLGNQGAVNNILYFLGIEKQQFFANKLQYLSLLIFSEQWKEAGWYSIIYMAAIGAIDVELYEASIVDGANRWKQIIYVTWPGIKSAAVILALVGLGNVMRGGFDQIINLYNPTQYDISDILSTYIYRKTFQSVTDYGFSTAAGLFNSLVDFILIYGADRMVKLFGERGIF